MSSANKSKCLVISCIKSGSLPRRGFLDILARMRSNKGTKRVTKQTRKQKLPDGGDGLRLRPAARNINQEGTPASLLTYRPPPHHRKPSPMLSRCIDSKQQSTASNARKYKIRTKNSGWKHQPHSRTSTRIPAPTMIPTWNRQHTPNPPHNPCRDHGLSHRSENTRHRQRLQMRKE